MAPRVVDAAAELHLVRPGLVDEIAAELLEQVGRDELAALGGGRVVDAAKAIVAARGGRAMAVPTTLSGAEMTRIHRLPTGVDAPRVRCAVVVCDPAVAASQPVPELAASALNGLGHAVEAPCTPKANPVSALAARRGAQLLVRAFDGAEPDRDALALGALLAGYSIDSAHYGLHHVLAQTLVRVAGAGHGPANAALLGHSLRALEWRFPAQHAALADALGEDPGEAIARLCRLVGDGRLRDLGVERDDLPACADTAAERAELDLTPPRADRAELLGIYERAW